MILKNFRLVNTHAYILYILMYEIQVGYYQQSCGAKENPVYHIVSPNKITMVEADLMITNIIVNQSDPKVNQTQPVLLQNTKSY